MWKIVEKCGKIGKEVKFEGENEQPSPGIGLTMASGFFISWSII